MILKAIIEKMGHKNKVGQMFFAMVKNPRSTGALVASSTYLANAMAKEVGESQSIVELGSGTGAITRALLKKYPHTPLTCVEIQDDLVAELKTMLPQLNVVNQEAKQVLDNIPIGEQGIAIVSSLPFRSLPKRVYDETSHSILALLKRAAHSQLIQFTYGGAEPFQLPKAQEQFYHWHRVTHVWRNIPPAFVWTLKYQAPKL